MRKTGISGNAGLFFVVVITVAAAFFSLGTPPAQAMETLNGHVPPAIARFHLQPLREFPPSNSLNLAISLPLRNERALDDLLRQIYDPASTNYHHYLTPEQFTVQFGPSQQDYDAVRQFMQSNGLTVTAIYPNRTLVDVSGSVAAIERVLHTPLHVYQHPFENRTFFAPDTDPSLDLDVPIEHIGGLDNFTIPRPLLKAIPLAKAPAGVQPASGSGPNGLYMGKDFRAAYAPGVTLDGAGQTVGLLELEGYYPKDILTYETNAGLPDLTLTNIYVDGFTGAPNAADTNGIIEVSLDIEMAISMATNASKIAVFEEQNGGNIVDILNAIATNSFVKQISSSWLIGDSSSYDGVYKEMAAQGQSFFQASGDDGAYFTSNENLEEYTDDTNITLVGGTTLSTSGGAWSSEKVWNWYSSGLGDAASGGGTNFNGIRIPSWQRGVSMANNQGSTTLRNIPDVALTADGIYVQATNQQFYVGGTSCAAPLWAGFTALVNQQAVAEGQPYVGFLNPAVYTIGQSANYTNDFHDITTGNNTNLNVANKYFAVPGYDLCTGWGTPNGQNLINALVGTDLLGISPAGGFTAVGVAGGPFSPNSQVYTLTNSSASPLSWSLNNTSAWLNASSTAGVLPADGVTNVTISLTPAADALPVGVNSATLVFTDLVTQVAQSFQFNLQITEPLGISPSTGFSANGFSGGPFSPNSQVYTLTNFSAASLSWSLINTSSWLDASVTGSVLPAGGATNVTVSLNAAAALLAVGTYSAALTVTDEVSGVTQNLQFSLQVTEPLAIGPATGFNASGAVGGPFSVSSQIFSLTNTGSQSLDWQAAGDSWLNLSPSAGMLAGGGVAPVTVSLNSGAYNLPAGIYTGQVSFTDESSGLAQNRQFTLTIGQSIVQNGGFETGSFPPWNLIGTTINGKGTVYNDVVSVANTANGTGSNFIHSGTYGAALGHIKFSWLYQSLATTPGQSYLLSFWMNNYGGYTPNQILVDWNTNASGTNTIFNQSNFDTSGAWTNLLFVLTATRTNTTLVFGTQNNNYYFGLDDVYVWPIPWPTIRSFSPLANNALSLTWYSLTNMVYEVEYSTNLETTNWFILSTNTATGPTLSVTNSFSQNPVMFYRVLRLP